MRTTTIGIDLGCSFSVVAVYEDGVGAEVIPNDIGSRTTPSCVSITDSEILVGEAAVVQATMSPLTTFRNVKLMLGSSYRLLGPQQLGPLVVCDAGRDLPRYQLPSSGGEQQPRRLPPEEIASMLLSMLRMSAEQYLQHPVTEAVIAVPSYFDAVQRQATIDAGTIAGFERMKLVHETSAAALTYAHDRGEEKTVVIVDVGGGGGSVSVVRTSPSGGVVVLAASGARLPGGEDLNARMMNHFAVDIRKKYMKELFEESSACEILRSVWEEAKRKLSRLPQASLRVFLPGIIKSDEDDYQIVVRREHFEELCRDDFHSIVAGVELQLYHAKVDASMVDDVILMGGTTRVPKLRSLIQGLFGGKELCRPVNPDEGVACGAALHAACASAVLQDVFPHELYLDRDQLFPSGCLLPLTCLVPLQRSNSNPTKRVFKIDQGPLRLPRRLMASYELSLEGDKAVLSSDGVTVRVQINRDGILDVEFVPSKERPPVLRRHVEYCLRPTEIAALQQAAQEARREEALRNRRMEAKNALENACREILSRQVGDEADPEAAGLHSRADEALLWLLDNQDASKDEFVAKLEPIERTRNAILQRRLEAEDRARREQREAEERARKAQLEAEDRARREQQEAEERARKEQLEAEDRARREQHEAEDRKQQKEAEERYKKKPESKQQELKRQQSERRAKEINLRRKIEVQQLQREGQNDVEQEAEQRWKYMKEQVAAENQVKHCNGTEVQAAQQGNGTEASGTVSLSAQHVPQGEKNRSAALNKSYSQAVQSNPLTTVKCSGKIASCTEHRNVNTLDFSHAPAYVGRRQSVHQNEHPRRQLGRVFGRDPVPPRVHGTATQRGQGRGRGSRPTANQSVQNQAQNHVPSSRRPNPQFHQPEEHQPGAERGGRGLHQGEHAAERVGAGQRQLRSNGFLAVNRDEACGRQKAPGGASERNHVENTPTVSEPVPNGKPPKPDRHAGCFQPGPNTDRNRGKTEQKGKGKGGKKASKKVGKNSRT